MPSLLLRDRGLVKTRCFKDPVYVGDPINAIRIFNDKEVDELLLLDITASLEGRPPDLRLLGQVASECFMPLAYGGGITTIEQIREILALGLEKVVLNTQAERDPELVRRAADRFGSQAIVVSMDARKRLLGGHRLWILGGRKQTPHEPAAFAARMQELGAGELIVNSIDRDGTLAGYDLALLRGVATAVDIPVVAAGGAGSLADFAAAVSTGASAVSAGAFFVFQGPHRAVLISFPRREDLESAFAAPPEHPAAAKGEP
jgi:imidazole glycerol-phosphate synthase subunit HisF